MDYKYASEASQEVILIVYEDEQGNKYLDEEELKVLLGRESMNQYAGPDGFVYVTSDSVTRNGIPNDLSYKGTIEPDFSDTYPYNSNLGLYSLTEYEIMDLIRNFETTFPYLKVVTQIENVEEKDINNEKKEIFDKTENIENDKDYNNNLNEMFDDIKNEKTDYDDNLNIKK